MTEVSKRHLGVVYLLVGIYILLYGVYNLGDGMYSFKNGFTVLGSLMLGSPILTVLIFFSFKQTLVIDAVQCRGKHKLEVY